jgi:hypothetical protein
MQGGLKIEKKNHVKFQDKQKKTHEYNENICSIFMTNEIKRHVHVYYWS